MLPAPSGRADDAPERSTGDIAREFREHLQAIRKAEPVENPNGNEDHTDHLQREGPCG